MPEILQNLRQVPRMAFPSGFEPLAYRLGGGRSILLGYGNTGFCIAEHFDIITYSNRKYKFFPERNQNMTVSEFYQFLCERIPAELTLESDRDGMSCCPDPQKEVQKVLICLDVTTAAIDEAIEEGCEVILAHHPMLHGGIDSVQATQYRGNKLIRLISHGIAVMSFHTRLDGVDGGVSDMLADLVGVKNTVKICEKGICRLGELEAPLPAAVFAQKIKEALGAPFVEYSDTGRLIRKVAVGGGSVNSYIPYAIAAGADALVGGEIGYHNLTDSADMGISLFAAGHFYTENPVCARLFELTAEAGLLPIITFSNCVESV